ncbi:hypothetical protein ACFW1A_23505 [Kitasatospora sp. NPDC058965]|uniref:hypothetical protein n=1 Tax=Kitasatospora sp. NPDC058965 TaxID=3346682 RepID=UPI00368DAFB7
MADRQWLRAAGRARAAQARREAAAPPGRRVRRLRRVGAALLALAALFPLAVLVWFTTLLPSTFDDAARYRAARPCPTGTVTGACLVTSTELTVEVHAERGRDPDDRIVVRPLAGGGREGIKLHGTEPVLTRVRPGDRVEVERWQGAPVAVSLAGLRQPADQLPSDGPYLLVAGLTCTALVLQACVLKARRLWRGVDSGQVRGLLVTAAVALMLALLGKWLRSLTALLLLEAVVAAFGTICARPPHPVPPEPLVPPRPRHDPRPVARLRTLRRRPPAAPARTRPRIGRRPRVRLRVRG